MSVRAFTWKQVMVIAVLVSLAGCATTVWWGSPTNLRSTTLSLGMSKQQVQSVFGPPQSVITQQLGDLMVETWTYLDKTLTFHNGLLYSWGAAPCPACGQ